MAALGKVPQYTPTRKSPISKSGVLSISGFGVKVKMQRGHLEIEDGVGMKRRRIMLPRVGHGLKRLVCISEDGFATLSALKWLTDVGASFIILTSTGKLSFVTGPSSTIDAHLHRTQAAAISNGRGLGISRALIDAKLQGQEKVVRERLDDTRSGEVISSYREKLAVAGSFDAIRHFEAQAALNYFAAWRRVPVQWPKADLQRIPEHWRTAGARQSPLSGSPRLAVTPVHALLNYCFGLLEAETRIAVSSLGLDPCLGLGLHTDTSNRDSLVFDVLEPVRPQIESWVLRWIGCEYLSRADFFETPTGNCRLRSQLCARLGETAPTWGKLVAPWAEYVSHMLSTNVDGIGRIRRSMPATRLTQRHRSEAHGIYLPKVQVLPEPRRTCRNCGRTLKQGKTHCGSCAAFESSKNMVEAAKLGRIATHTPKAEALRAETQRQHAAAIKAWQPSQHPTWLTENAYLTRIQPALRDATVSAIASGLGVSLPYATQIRQGRRRPHPRHWLVLAELVNISPS